MIDFLTKMADEFESKDGTFPVASFPQADSSGHPSGVTMPPLKTVYPDWGSTGFCIQATYKKDTSIIKHVTQDSEIKDGSC